MFQLFLILYCFVFRSKRDNELLLRLIANLNMLLKDESVNVVKKAILTLTQLYKVTLQVNTVFHYTQISWYNHYRLSFQTSILFCDSGCCAPKQHQICRRHAGTWSHR